MSDELVLDPVPRSSRDARRWIRDRLRGLDDGDLTDDVELLTTEVVTNALLHAGTPIRLTVRPDGGCVRVDVHDGSTSEPVPREYMRTATIGRGLGILDRLAHSWGWTVTSQGKTVWFVVCSQNTVRDEDPVDGEKAGPDTAAATGSTRSQQPEGTADRSAESGLGRYRTDQAGPLVEIRLLRLPVHLLVASQEHHDALLREFRLIALADPSAHPVPRDMAALVEELGMRYASARARRDGEMRDALGDGLLQIDQVFQAPAAAAEEMRYLGALLRQADRYCTDNRLLTLARPPLVQRFSDWYLGEIVAQLGDQPPTPWDGPLTLDYQGPAG